MRVLSGQSKRLFFVVRLIVYALKIIGLAPFGMSAVASARINPYDSRIEVFQYSKIGLAYNIFFIIPVLIVVAIKFYALEWFVKDTNESSSFDAATVVYTTKSILLVFAAFVVIIHLGCKQRDAASIMNRLFEVGHELSVLKQQPFNKRSLIFVTIHVIINVSLWTTIWIRRIVFHLDDLLSTFLRTIPDYIIYWFTIEYFIMVSLLARYLRTVNKCLLNFNEFGNHWSRPRVRDSSPRISEVFNLPNDRSSEPYSLKLLHSLRTKLIELCEDVSSFFSFPILFCIACCFIPLVYEIYTVSIFSENADIPVARTASYTFVIIFLYIYPVLSLSLNVTRTGKESKQTGPIIHKLLVAPIGREIKAELKQFSLQLLHEDVKFTACGFFTLDSSLLLSMLGGAASYFVVLMQFRSACNCESSNVT